MTDEIKWKTKGIILKGLNDDYLAFKEDYPLGEIKKIIENNFIILCRKVQCQQTCHLYKEEIREEPCLLMRKILENFLQTTSKFVNHEKQWQVEKYLKSILAIISFFKLSEEWKADLSTNWGNWYYKGIHTWLHDKNSKKALEFIHDFIQNFDFIDKDIEKKYLIFVEGDSEQKALENLTLNLNIFFGLGSKIISLGGKDNAKINNLRTLLRRLKEKHNDFFIILDGADNNVKQYKEDLVREGLIKENHFILWDKEFEDSFPPKIIYDALKEIITNVPFNLSQLQAELSNGKRIVKSIEKLSHNSGNKIDYNSIKVKVASKASELLNGESDCELVRKLKEINKIIEEEKNQHYFLDPKEALKDI